MQQTVKATFRALVEASIEPFDPQLNEFFEPGEELLYQVRTPAGGRADPPGLFVYISPKPGAGVPDGWGEVLDEHNLIWVGAQNSGNEVHVARRVGFALLAPAIAVQTGAVDASRVVLAGFSGGGRVASMMMPAYPDRFAGALFICGANPLFTVTPDALDGLSQVPMVFLTGTGDFNLEDTRMAITTFQQAGLTKVRLEVVDGLDHALPGAADLDAALSAIIAG